MNYLGLYPNKLKAIGIVSSMLLGLAFVYLFCFEPVGVSHLIYFILTVTSIFIPIMLLYPDRVNQLRLKFLPLLVLAFVLSLSFIYRMDAFWMTMLFILLPILYGIALALMFHSKADSLKISTFIFIPVGFTLFWFGECAKFLGSFGGLKLKRDSKAYSYFKRIITGLIIGIPFFLIFLFLLSLADQDFAQLWIDLYNATIGKWFKDLESLIEFVMKGFIAFVVSIYLMVLHYSFWNPDSVLASVVREHDKFKVSWNKNWDVLVSSIVLFMLNFLLVMFVAVQFTVLFGGQDNVIGQQAQFTYAEYARRGFGELLVITGLIYLIMLILNFKVYTSTHIQKFIFRFNYFVMGAAALIISLSAINRVNLYIDAYGYTTLRIFVMIVVAFVALLSIMLMLSSIAKDAVNFISKTTVILSLAVGVIWFLTPEDYLVAKLNHERYKETGKVDLPYMLNLTDEAIPVLWDIASDRKTPELSRILILAELAERKELMENSRLQWQSFNFTHNYTYNLLKDKVGDTDYKKEAEMSVENFIENYFNEIESGDYDSAKEYWSGSLTRVNTEQLSSVRISSYKLIQVPSFDNWAYTNFYDSYGGTAARSNYWQGMTVEAELEIDLKDTLNTENIYTTTGQYCYSDMLTLKLEDGEWKIHTSTYLPMAQLEASDTEGSVYSAPFYYILNPADNYTTCPLFK